jgi:hypothetical protein
VNRLRMTVAPRDVRSLRAGGLAVAAMTLATVLAACGGAAAPPPSAPPAASVGPVRTVSPAVAPIRAEIVRALGTHNLVLSDSQAPTRPAESALLASAPRAVYQVILPADPSHGFIVVYEFPDAGRAAEAAAEEQRYLGTGPGRVQTPQGTVYVLRQLGTTVIVYSWLPAAAPDPATPGIQAALETLGVGFPIAN